MKDAVRRVSSRFDLDYWRQIDDDCEFPEEYWDALAKAGLFGVLIGKEYGGLSRGIVDLYLGVEATAETFAGLGSYLFLSGALVSTIFSNNATKDQRKDLLPKLARGELKISIALTEESSGYDATAIRSKAIKTGSDAYCLCGAKTFVNNAELADYLILFARTTPAENSPKKSLGVTMFLVDAKDQAIKKKKLKRAGMNFISSYALEFDNLVVGRDRLIGETDRGWYNVVHSFNLDRIATSASLVGTSRLALKEASRWANERRVFGRRIGENQGIQFPLADAFAQVSAAEIMGMKAASNADRGRSYDKDAAYALLSSVNASTAATERALQTFGGHGYYKEYHVERFWRDVRAHTVHPISQELLLASIAERSLGLPKSY